MTQVGIMLEAQEGLGWERWRRICRDTDTLGFASLRRSDHLVSLAGDAERECFERLEAGIKTLRDIWSKTNPKPARNPIPLLIGGKGRKRTLPLAAREAAEWNLSRLDADAFRELSGALDENCREIGRDPSDIKRSVMTPYIIGRDEDELRERALKLREVVASLKGQDADEVLRTMRPRAFVGRPEEIAEQMREHAKLGVDLFMLQHFLLDDSDALELLAREVLPAVA